MNNPMTINKLKVIMLSVFAMLLQPMAGNAQIESYTFKLTQSTSAYQFWTTPPSERVFRTSAVPARTGSPVKVYAAKNEFEPFQIIVKPAASGNVTISMGNFGAGITTELFQVKYVNVSTATDYLGKTGYNPDPLWPISNGASIGVTANQNTAFWINVSVPSTTAAGDYTANVTIGGIAIPVRLHVFNFTLPAQLHVKSQMNFNYNTILTKYGVSGTGAEYWMYVDKMKKFFIDHRLTPKSVLWSGGLTTNGAAPYIDYNCNGTFTDNDDIWGFEQPAARYLNGTGQMSGTFTQPFNGGVGFPSFMTATFQNNDASADQRPSTFCSQTRTANDWYTGNNPSSAYNQKWFQYMTAMRNYLSVKGHLSKAYYYFANEPQNQAAYNAVAWYSRYLKQYAPNLKLMVSEEPKPEIYNHANYIYNHQIDIWLAHFGLHFNPTISQQRLKNNSEESWIYFLKSTYLPRFNSITLDHPAIEGKFLGWFLWKYRVRGIAYYTFNDWSSNPWTSPNPNGQNGEMFLMYPPSEVNTNITYGSNGHRFVPSIRLEMIRDGLEDYEYFYLLSGGQPQPGVVNAADAQVDKVITMPTSYTRDSEFMYNLRRLIGLKLGGEIATIPEIAPASVHSRSNGAPGNYYINFQDPSGQPTDNPLTVNGRTYMKIGSNLYSPSLGYGWYPAADVPSENFYTAWDQWVDPEPKKLLGSAVINDWGREDVFEFDLPNGTYNVTVCVGSRSSTRYHTIVIEGINVINGETTNNSWITRTKTVTVKDKKLSLQMGKFDQIGYLNYLHIEAVPSNSYLLWTR
jgi:hypothetical protein